MPEILTESFCERCGTRYTFESTAPRAKPLRGLKTIGRGLRNFVLSDDTSMDEAMAAARSEAERDVTTQQLDAFHSTFNFCMSCRQYTCAKCWNEAEGQCLTCSPHLGHEILPAPFPTVQPVAEAAPAAADLAFEAPAAWPLADIDMEAAAEAAAEPIEEIDLAARLRRLELEDQSAAVELPIESTADIAPEPELVAEAATGAEPEASPVPGTAPAPAITGLGPDQTVEEAIAAFEASRTGAPEAEPAVTPAVEPEPVAAADAEIDEAPLAAAAAADDLIAQPVWTATPPLPEAPASDAAPGIAAAAQAEAPTPSSEAPAQPQWPSPPQWPSQPQWPSRRPTTPRPATILGRPIMPTEGIDALWAASNQEVLGAAPLGVAPRPGGQPAPLAAQPCVNCGLSLSANARFCRRCGSAQAHP
jgi:hypothetical protein